MQRHRPHRSVSNHSVESHVALSSAVDIPAARRPAVRHVILQSHSRQDVIAYKTSAGKDFLVVNFLQNND